MANQMRLRFKCVECGHVFFDTVVEKCPACDCKRLTFAREAIVQGEPLRQVATVERIVQQGAFSDRERFLLIKKRQKAEAARAALKEGGGPAPIGG